MPNAWITHVKKYAEEHNLSYGCAITTPECKASYVKAPRKARTPKQPKEKAPRKARTSKQPKEKTIQERLQERIEKNKKDGSTPLTEKQLMMKQDLENKIGSFKRAERISSIPSAPEAYKSTKLQSSTNIPRLIKKKVIEPPKTVVGSSEVKKSSKTSNERESDKTNRIFVKFMNVQAGLKAIFYRKSKKQTQHIIFSEIVGDSTFTKKNFSRTQLIQIFKDLYDKKQGDKYFYYDGVPFNDLIFEF